MVIEQASKEEKPMIVLVSTDAGREKIDLKVASTIFFMEACKQTKSREMRHQMGPTDRKKRGCKSCSNLCKKIALEKIF